MADDLHVANRRLDATEDEAVAPGLKRRREQNLARLRRELHEPRHEQVPKAAAQRQDGDRSLEGLVLSSTEGGERRLDVRALFVFIGAEAGTTWLQDEVALDAKGFVLTGRELDGQAEGEAPPLLLETSRPGVFAVGDVRSASIKRVASAVGEARWL